MAQHKNVQWKDWIAEQKRSHLVLNKHRDIKTDKAPQKEKTVAPVRNVVGSSYGISHGNLKSFNSSRGT